MKRKVLIATVGHVDHGKSSILDKIRGTTIVEREAGKITQAIGASIIPIETVQRVCGNLLQALGQDITIPGLLAIDTPGHAAFSNLRKRGGSLADIAIVVVDINEGFKPQTEEAIDILKQHKTPFILAANKIDLINGWRRKHDAVLQDAGAQEPQVITSFEQKMYELVGSLHEKFGLEAERFDRVDDYTKQIAIVPTSAETGEGIPELLMVLTGLSQKFLEQSLKIDVAGPAKGTIMEVKEEKGLGKTLDVIIYDGTLNVNDTIIIGGLDGPIITKVKALFEPAELQEMRDKKTKFKSVKSVAAAIGVKISAKDIEPVIGGMPIEAVGDQKQEDVIARVQEQIESVVIETEKKGLVIKADALGSLEALVVLCREKGLKIRKASIGNVTKADIVDAESNIEEDPVTAVVLGFNVDLPSDVEPGKVKVITHKVIYGLLDDYQNWVTLRKKELEESKLDMITRPCKIELLSGYVFRQSNPAVCGCEVLDGVLKTGMGLMKKDGKTITTVKGLQAEKDTLSKAEKGKQVAVSMPNVTVGRQINEGDILYSAIPEEDFKKLKELKQYLTKEEKELLKEIASIMRENYPVWGV